MVRMKAKLKILLISDQVPGHVSQSKGLLVLMAEHYAIDLQTVTVRLKQRNLSRLLLSFLLNHLSFNWITRLTLALHQHDFNPQFEPDLIVSTGGNSAFFNIALRRHYGCKNLFIGSLRHLQARHFSAVLTLEAIGSANNIVMTVTPMPITPEQAAVQGKAYLSSHGQPGKTLWAIVIGGDGAGYHYQPDDWLQLAQALSQLAAQHQIQWLLTTSRRSGETAEQLLQAAIPADILFDAVWYHQNPRKVMLDFLGAAARVFCTVDSMSMIMEAISAGKEPCVLAPENGKADERYQSALNQFVHLGLIHKVSIKQLANEPLPNLRADTPGLAFYRQELLERIVALIESHPHSRN